LGSNPSGLPSSTNSTRLFPRDPIFCSQLAAYRVVDQQSVATEMSKLKIKWSNKRASDVQSEGLALQIIS
jgi:hypothetical protein